MPRYNFHCLACKKQFSEVLTLAEYEEDEVICPHCGSDDVERSWARSTPLPQEGRLER
jgi:putative FmdB family regulatory protein